MVKEDKLKALDVALGQIEKQFGKGSVMKLGDSSVNMNVEAVPTGSLSLDIALGLGGVPKGRIIEIYGPESSGKTTVALHMVAEVQKRGGIAGFIDAEHALDPVYAKNIGVDIDNLYISQPDNGEQAMEITETMVRSGAVDIVIVDSVAALVPKAEIEGDMGDSQAGEIIGNRTRIKVVKNKVAPPFKEAEFDIMFGKGISKEGDVLDLAAGLGIIVKSGAWYAYKDAKIGQGRENAKQYLRDNPEILEEVETQVREHYGLPTEKKQTESAKSESKKGE